MSDPVAPYRTFNQSMADDPDVMALSDRALRVLFLLRLTLGPAGIDIVHPSMLADRASCTREQVEEALRELEQLQPGSDHGFIRRERNVVWIVNALRFEHFLRPTNDKHTPTIRKQVGKLGDRPIVRAFRARYAAWFDGSAPADAEESPQLPATADEPVHAPGLVEKNVIGATSGISATSGIGATEIATGACVTTSNLRVDRSSASQLELLPAAHELPVTERPVTEGRARRAQKLAAAAKGIDTITSVMFERSWVEYPPRDGDQGRTAAAKAWNARVREGEDEEAMYQGTLRYAAWVRAKYGPTPSQYVKQAATFYGPSRFYQEPWTIYPQLAARSMTPRASEMAMAGARRLGPMGIPTDEEGLDG